MSTQLKDQVANAVSADQLSCKHKGNCPTCPICKEWRTDGFPDVKEEEWKPTRVKVEDDNEISQEIEENKVSSTINICDLF